MRQQVVGSGMMNTMITMKIMSRMTTIMMMGMPMLITITMHRMMMEMEIMWMMG